MTEMNLGDDGKITGIRGPWHEMYTKNLQDIVRKLSTKTHEVSDLHQLYAVITAV